MSLIEYKSEEEFRNINESPFTEDVVTTGFYTESDLIEFANYCMSEERHSRFDKDFVFINKVNDTDLDAFFNTVRR